MIGLELTQTGLLSERETRADRRRAFMRRQFDAAATPSQTKFDLLFGVALPIVCFYFDPFVFRGFGGGSSDGLLESFQAFTYIIAALEIVTLLLWLVARGRLGEWATAAGGVLLAGALFCCAVGLVLLPFSLIGLLLLIGTLGFTPFLTGFVYLRNGARAARLARNGLSWRANFVGSLVVGAALAFGLAALGHVGVSRFVSASVEGVLAGRELSASSSRALRAVGWLADAEFDRLAWDYNGERDPARRERLASAYRELTAEDLETRLRRLAD
ncbi:MAG: hypothetical protein LC802_17965 [Acidobacteria bacterium]|nr:hypothetical protein [Acidobacteriota bacterium]